jgi:hypothetical protein
MLVEDLAGQIRTGDLPIQANLRSRRRFASLAKVEPPDDGVWLFSIVQAVPLLVIDGQQGVGTVRAADVNIECG